MNVTAVIVHYGDPTPTVRLANEVRGYGAHAVVVANDQRSRPAGLEPGVEWRVPPRNLGYAGALIHVRDDSTPFAYVVLNTDVEISRTAFERCLDVLSLDRVGVVGPRLHRRDGSLQSGAARLTRWRKAPDVRVDPGQSDVDCLWVTGAVLFVRRETLDMAGVDSSYFLGSEDVDLCLRASRAGWRVVCAGTAPAVHHGSVVISGPRWSYYSTRNRVWLVRAHFGRLVASVSWLAQAAVLPRVFVADVVKRRGTLATRLSLMALRDALGPKPAPHQGPRPDEPVPARVMNW